MTCIYEELLSSALVLKQQNSNYLRMDFRKDRALLYTCRYSFCSVQAHVQADCYVA